MMLPFPRLRRSLAQVIYPEMRIEARLKAARESYKNDFNASHKAAFTVAGSVLTPEMAAKCRELLEEASFGQWSCRDLADSVKAVLLPSLLAASQKEGDQ